MVVNTTEGTATSYPTSQIESVVFTEEATESTPAPAKVRMKRNIVFLGHSIWRNDNYFVKYQNSHGRMPTQPSIPVTTTSRRWTIWIWRRKPRLPLC